MFTRRAVLIVLVLASITLAQSARGQVSSPGNRVRIMESHSRRPLIVGWLVRQTIDSVVIVGQSIVAGNRAGVRAGATTPLGAERRLASPNTQGNEDGPAPRCGGWRHSRSLDLGLPTGVPLLQPWNLRWRRRRDACVARTVGRRDRGRPEDPRSMASHGRPRRSCGDRTNGEARRAAHRDDVFLGGFYPMRLATTAACR